MNKKECSHPEVYPRVVITPFNVSIDRQNVVVGGQIICNFCKEIVRQYDKPHIGLLMVNDYISSVEDDEKLTELTNGQTN